jgi:isoamyl acetate esterase
MFAMAAQPKLLLLGDSLTQLAFEGWGATLANVYQRRADVVNRGYGGYNTEFYRRMLDGDEESLENVGLVLVFFGANDAALPGLADHHHVSLARYKENLRTIVSRVREKYQTKRILLVTPPPVHHQQRLAYQIQRYGIDKATGQLERTCENTGRYAAACREVAAAAAADDDDTQRQELPCLDLYTLMLADPAWGRFFNDGLHFTTDGHDFVGQAVLSAIEQYFPDWHVTKDPQTGQWCNSSSACPALSSRGPYHDEIDHTNPDTAFEKDNKST